MSELRDLLYMIVSGNFYGFPLERYRTRRDIFRLTGRGLRVLYKESDEQMFKILAIEKIKNPS